MCGQQHRHQEHTYKLKIVLLSVLSLVPCLCQVGCLGSFFPLLGHLQCREQPSLCQTLIC